MNEDNISIELLRGDDEISRFMEWRKGDGDIETISDLKDTIGGVQGGTVWVYIATVGEQWVGSIKLQRFHEDTAMADGARRGCIGALEVEAEFRRRGIGRALTERALREARNRGFDQVTLNVEPTNEAARELYRSLGFEKFREATLRWQGEEFEVDSMIVSLHWDAKSRQVG